MADCLRALGQPAQALKLARSPAVEKFAPPAKAEIPSSKQVPGATSARWTRPCASWSRLLCARGLARAVGGPAALCLRRHPGGGRGRDVDALAWFHRTHAIDGAELTDADERADLLERRLGRAEGLDRCSGRRRARDSQLAFPHRRMDTMNKLTPMTCGQFGSDRRERWGRRISAPGSEESHGDHRTQPPRATRGVLYVHSAPSALCPHIEWAAGGVLGIAVNLEVDPTARAGQAPTGRCSPGGGKREPRPRWRRRCAAGSICGSR